jgi:hypothetical protein
MVGMAPPHGNAYDEHVFCFERKIADQYPLFSAYDARQMIIHTYASKISSPDDVLCKWEFAISNENKL